MNKILYIGTIKEQRGAGSTVNAKIFCKVTIEGGRLSISGVIGPKSNGDAWGSCGQIDSTLKEAATLGPDGITYSPEWSRPLLEKFLLTWDCWHLNDMRAYCEHQAAHGWHREAVEKIKTYQWRLKPEIAKKKKELEEEAIERAKSVEEGRAIGFYAQDRAILRLEGFIKTPDPELSPELSRYYEATKDTSGYFAHVEEKARGWISYDEDKRGILSKPCEVCGYKYGSEWKREEIPANVVEFLESLPASKITPAWI